MNNIFKQKTLKTSNKDELVQFIKNEMEKNGNECDLNHIDTSLITDMSHLFSEKYKLNEFNHDISSWNTSKVTNMYGMFEKSKFNQDISNWNTSIVTDMMCVFKESQFNQPINNWNTSNVITMAAMFRDSKFTQTISDWDASNVESIESIFKNSKINKIPEWNYFKIDDIQHCFDDCSALTESLPDWYQFNHITNSQDRKKSYDDYLKKRKLIMVLLII